MKKRTGGALLASLAALTSVYVAPAWSAPAGAEPADELTEIIVTARRVEENLQDVPISISVFNQEQLANRNVVTAQDLATFVPSLSVNSNYGADNSSFSIRGFVQDTGTAPSVGVFFADVIAPRAVSNGLPGGDGAGPGDFFDLENVQILKGPQGTLFGRNTTGGDILLVPKKPGSELTGYIEGGFGNYNDAEVQAVINVPVSDSFRLRAGVEHESRKGYLHSNTGIGPDNFNDINYTAVRLSAVVDILPDLENYTIARFTHSDTNGSIDKLIAADPTNLLFAPAALAQLKAQGSGFYDIQQTLANSASKLQQWQIINTTTWKATDDLTVKNIASYGRLRDFYNDAIFGTQFFTPTNGTFPYIGFPYNTGTAIPYGFAASTPYPGSATASEKTITEELQFQGNAFKNDLVWQAGGYFELALPEDYVGAQSGVFTDCVNPGTFNCSDVLGYALATELQAGGIIPPTVPFVPLASINQTIGRTRFRDYAFYAQGTYKLAERLKLTGGIRYTNDKEGADDIQKTYRLLPYPNFGKLPDIPGVSPLCTDGGALPDCKVSYEQTSHAPTFLIDFDYTPVDDLLLYAKYTRGYREGVINPTAPPPLNLVKPEKVDAYEVGEKFTIRGPISGTVNMAAFYNNFSNQQIQVGFNTNVASATPGNPFAAPENAGKSRIYGLELDSSLKLFPGFRLDLGYTYLKTRIESASVPTLPAGAPWITSGAFHEGDELVLSPRNKASVTGTYTLPLPTTVGSVSFAATFTHTDKQLVNYADRETAAFTPYSYVGSTDLLNLNLSWNEIMGSPVDVSAFATNVTEQHYYTFIAGLGGTGGPGFEVASVGQPRFYGLRVRLHYH
jgi:iron complex outermembrane receptor protein